MCGAVGILVSRALGIKEPVELLLVEGGALLRSISDGDGVVGAALVAAAAGTARPGETRTMSKATDHPVPSSRKSG